MTGRRVLAIAPVMSAPRHVTCRVHRLTVTQYHKAEASLLLGSLCALLKCITQWHQLHHNAKDWAASHTFSRALMRSLNFGSTYVSAFRAQSNASRSRASAWRPESPLLPGPTSWCDASKKTASTASCNSHAWLDNMMAILRLQIAKHVTCYTRSACIRT